MNFKYYGTHKDAGYDVSSVCVWTPNIPLQRHEKMPDTSHES